MLANQSRIHSDKREQSATYISIYKLGVKRCLVRMRFHSRKLLSLLFSALILVGCTTRVVDVEREKILSLSFNEFDQTEGSGFRLLLEQKKHVAAAELIEDYISRHLPNLTERELVSLHFHTGQLYGIACDAGKAVPHLKKAKYQREPSPDGHPLYWNAYVDATSAFISGDRRGVIAARERMGEMNEGFHRLVDSFITNFEEPYVDLVFGQKMKNRPNEEPSRR